MGSFDEAVHDAANAVKPFAQALDDASRECHEATRYLGALGEGLKGYRTALDEIVAALVQDTHDVEQALTETTSEAATDLNNLKEAVGLAVTEWEEVFGAEKAALIGASDLMPELGEKLKGLAEAAEASTHGALEWASSVSQELDKAVESVEHAVGVGLAAVVADWRRALEGACRHLLDSLGQKLPAQLAEKESEWQPHVDQAKHIMEQAFDDISTHDTKVEEYIGERWVELKDHELKATADVKDKLTQEISSLGQTVSNYEGQLQVAAEMITEQQQLASQGATQLAHDLQRVREIWSTFGINS